MLSIYSIPLFIISQGIVIGWPNRTASSLPLFTIRGAGKVGRFRKYFRMVSDPTCDEPKTRRKNMLALRFAIGCT